MERNRLHYHPNGYPALQLRPRTTVFRYRHDANLHRLAARLEAWEHATGNVHFEARNLHRVPAKLAFELVNVYVALRERFPQVRVDFVDFHKGHDKDTLATTTAYSVFWPALRSWVEVAGTETLAELEEDLEEPIGFLEDAEIVLRRAARAELAAIRRLPADARPVDVTAVGSIDMGQVFSSPRRYQGLLDYWARRNATALRNGAPRRVVPTEVSAATFTLIHEFGHLVDTVICEAGDGSDAVVYGALSQALLDVDSPDVRQWRAHLLNYPVGYLSFPGPHQGGAQRQRATKQALRLTIREALGRYATVNRDELFAEAFAMSFGAKSPALRRRLAPMRRALVEVGAARSRVR